MVDFTLSEGQRELQHIEAYKRGIAMCIHAAPAVLVYHAVALWVPGVGGLVAFAAAQHRLGPAR